jgi:hypothetical protein
VGNNDGEMVRHDMVVDNVWVAMARRRGNWWLLLFSFIYEKGNTT